MIKRLTKITAALALVTTTACYLGSFQSPRAVGTGKMRMRVCYNFPAYWSKTEREKAELAKQDYKDGFMMAMVTYGAGSRFDIGAQGTYHSIGIHGKWWALMRKNRKGIDAAPVLWLNYFFSPKKISPKLTLLVGYPVSRISEVYLGYEMFYGPSCAKIVRLGTPFGRGEMDWRDFEDEDIFQDSILLGFDLNYQSIGFTAEIGYPLYNKYPVILFGLGFYGDLGGLF